MVNSKPIDHATLSRLTTSPLPLVFSSIHGTYRMDGDRMILDGLSPTVHMVSSATVGANSCRSARPRNPPGRKSD